MNISNLIFSRRNYVDLGSPRKQDSANRTIHKKLHPQGDGVLGHGEWGMEKCGLCPMPYALCPMPYALSRRVVTELVVRVASRREVRLSRERQLGMEFPADFHEPYFLQEATYI